MRVAHHATPAKAGAGLNFFKENVLMRELGCRRPLAFGVVIESALNAIEHLKLSCCEVSSSVAHNAKKSLSIPKQHAGRITKFIDGRESRMCEPAYSQPASQLANGFTPQPETAMFGAIRQKLSIRS